MQLECIAKVTSTKDGSVVQPSVKCVLHVGKYFGSKKWILLVNISGSSRKKVYKLEGNLRAICDMFLSDGKTKLLFETSEEKLEIRGTICSELISFLCTVYNGSLSEDMRKISDVYIIDKALIKKPTPLKQIEFMESGFKKHLNPQIVNSVVNLKEFDQQFLKLKMFLRELNLSYSLLNEEPTALGDMPLTVINLNNNDLSQSKFLWLERPVIRNHLMNFSLARTNLTQFPLALVNFPKLWKLDVSNNKLESLPNKLGKHPSLMVLDISGNEIDYLPFSFATSNLKKTILTSAMRFKENKKLGIPRSLESLTKMDTFPSLQELAIVTISSCSWWFDLTTRYCPRVLLNCIRNTSECVCGRMSMPYSHLTKCAPSMPSGMNAMMPSRDRYNFPRLPRYVCTMYHECYLPTKHPWK